jgi:predicted deacetylase
MTDSTSSSSPATDRSLCIVLHDVAGATRAACVRTLNAIRDVAGDAPVTLLAVPRYHGEAPSAELEAWLGERARRGDELALHGHTHRDDGKPRGWLDRLRRSHYTRGEGEFWALTRGEAANRIDAGIEWFKRNGWPLSGFVAPAWLMGEGAWGALAARPFEYTATLRHLIHLPGKSRVTSQSVVYSSSSEWRRSTSVPWNAFVALSERRNALLRLELHPRDADFSELRSSWQGILEKALRDRKPATVADFMRKHRPADVGTNTTWQTTTAD